MAFFFVVLYCVTYSYCLYYYKYGKLARYFLSNLYRFPSSYLLMIMVYGVRPFLKGIAHALFYEEWELQLWILSGVEFSTILLISVFQIVSDNHKSKLVLFLETAYSFFLILLNLLLIFKYSYLEGADELLLNDIETIITLVVYFMLILLVLRYLTELK